MDHKELQAIAQAAAKNTKTQVDPKEFQQMLTKITVEAIAALLTGNVDKDQIKVG